MQRDANTMAHVVLVLLNLIQHLVTFCGDNDDTLELLADIEKRWNQEENALFFLGFALHPEYNKTAVWILTQSLAKDGNWGDNDNYLSVERLVQAAKFYYGKYELHDSEATDVTKEQALNRLGKSLKKWLVKPSDLRLDMFEHGENEVEYWNMQKLEHYEIANLAAFLLDAVIQAATCERIFKGYAQRNLRAHFQRLRSVPHKSEKQTTSRDDPPVDTGQAPRAAWESGRRLDGKNVQEPHHSCYTACSLGQRFREPERRCHGQ